MKFQQSKVEPTRFQLAPMVDVVFLLLIFFIITSTYARWETELNIVVPAAEEGETDQRSKGELIVNVGPEGQIVVNNVTLSPGDLLERLSALAELYPDQPIILRGDENTKYEHIVRVLDICHQAKIWNVAFATRDPDSPVP